MPPNLIEVVASAETGALSLLMAMAYCGLVRVYGTERFRDGGFTPVGLEVPVPYQGKRSGEGWFIAVIN